MLLCTNDIVDWDYLQCYVTPCVTTCVVPCVIPRVLILVLFIVNRPIPCVAGTHGLLSTWAQWCCACVAPVALPLHVPDREAECSEHEVCLRLRSW